MWYDTFDNIFWLSIGTLIAGTVALVVKTIMKSRCDRVSLCCLHIHRNVDLEAEEEIHRIEHRLPSDDPIGRGGPEMKV